MKYFTFGLSVVALLFTGAIEGANAQAQPYVEKSEEDLDDELEELKEIIELNNDNFSERVLHAGENAHFWILFQDSDCRETRRAINDVG